MEDSLRIAPEFMRVVIFRRQEAVLDPREVY